MLVNLKFIVGQNSICFGSAEFSGLATEMHMALIQCSILHFTYFDC